MRKWTETDGKLQAIRQQRERKLRSRVKRKGPHKIPVRSHSLRNLAGLPPKSSFRLPFLNDDDIYYQVPKVFSVIENPEETLAFIKTVAWCLERGSTSIHFDHSKLSNHDLGAEILLGVVASEVKKTAAYRNVKLRMRGTYPSSLRKTRLIRSMGVVKKLNVEAEIDMSDLTNIEIFDFSGTKDHTVKPSQEDRKNRCARLFVNHVNQCLSHMSRRLTTDARGSLVSFIGEIIGNAEDHSGERKWHVCGYLDDFSEEGAENDELSFCEIVIYNFGKSIAQTFLELSPLSYAYSLVDPYVKAHESNGLFTQGWNKEDLLTLVALQGDVSCINKDASTDRGQGTIDLIQFFQRVASECSINGTGDTRMALISGKTHILFDDTYRIGEDGDGKERIAFNSSNDLNDRPDPQYVKHLKSSVFPGTLIAIKFPLKSSDTEVLPS